jgi:hypothetical protein
VVILQKHCCCRFIVILGGYFHLNDLDVVKSVEHHVVVVRGLQTDDL